MASNVKNLINRLINTKTIETEDLCASRSMNLDMHDLNEKMNRVDEYLMGTAITYEQYCAGFNGDKKNEGDSMDRNMQNLIRIMKEIGDHAKETAEDFEKYYAGFSEDKKNRWKTIEEESPNDDETVLVTWSDHSRGSYVTPIRAYWNEENQHFYALEILQNIPIQAEIWCRISEIPKERLQ